MARGNGGGTAEPGADDKFSVRAPSVSLRKGGGALSGIGEKFAANPVTGTGSMTVPLATSPGRSGFGPQLSLSYDSGAGNGPFGLGWSLSLPSITRRTDKGLPRYENKDESDVFILSGAEDLVPVLIEVSPGKWTRDEAPRGDYLVTRYRPRIEGLFSRVERWTRQSDGDTYWRSISKDNVTTFYGRTPESRITDPDNPARIFTWLICQSDDDKGNSIVYGYKAEDSSGVSLADVNERNRSPASRSAEPYPKTIRYCNTPSRLVEPDITKLSWLFEVVFDYGEGHYLPQPPDAEGREFVSASVDGGQPWPVRQDPFSRYRAGFEVRTYRLCRRVLMFHHFAAELGTSDYLVRATELGYRETPVASFVTSVVQSGFVSQADGTYLKRSLPPLEFEYSQVQVQRQVFEVDRDSLANLPGSIDGRSYQWLDLDGEGLQGVLAERDGAWYYKRNLSPLTFGFVGEQPSATARFEPISQLTTLPSSAHTPSQHHQFIDFAGAGQLDYAILDHPVAGFFKRTPDGDWDDFRALRSAPDVNWADPNLRFIDLNGDGHADVLITEDDVFTWYPSLAEDGFDAAVQVPRLRDEEAGPAIVFADASQSIFLGDMSGDGLTDIVRIRNGEVCYWPNLGYGRFGRKVTMGQSPWFDAPDLFNPRRLRLADIDGSGTIDIIYLAAGGAYLYFNQSGNRFAAAEIVPQLPQFDELSMVQALDLLGNGTACLVWSSSQPGDVGRSMRYVDLMGGQKPHLLVRSRNNFGAETRIFYAPSTKFYLSDRQAGQPWVTKLPFVVHVVERVETDDWISRNRFVTRYAYHHGYFDGSEREFRGFGMVEQQDTEELGALSQTGAFPNATNIDAASYVPPTLTRSWFHTGCYPQRDRVSQVFAHEYYQEATASQLPDTVLPTDLTGDEIREALRSLKGALLRQEIYALDGTDKADRPYSIAEKNYTIKKLQPFGDNPHTVFFARDREAFDLHYERMLYDIGGRQLADPRMTHSLVLAVDDYGNALQSVAVGYGRRHDDPDPLLTDADRALQKTLHATYIESAYTNPILADDAYRPPLPAETRTYELLKVTPDAGDPDITKLFGFDEMASKVNLAGDGHHDLPYEDVDATVATENQPYRRLIEHIRTLYRKDDLTAGLPLGTVESRALPFESYKLAFTPGLLSAYRRNGQDLLPNPTSVLRDEGGYVLSDDKKAAGLFPASDTGGAWWIPSDRMFFSSDAGDKPEQELANATSHFFLPRCFQDPFGNSATVLYDAHDLLLLETEDALNNKVTVGERQTDGSISNGNDYRVVQPTLVTDLNDNRSQVAFDGLGLVAGTAVMGKSSEKLGDSLSGFSADLTQAQIAQFFADPRGPAAADLLQNATSRIVYDLSRYASPSSTPEAPLPTFAATIMRETHVSDLEQGQSSKLRIGFAYSDGFGREIQKKMQAEPLVSAGPARWVASGWKIFNNMGNLVRQYEPFFDDTPEFKFGVTVGVSPILFYDPVERVVATLQPDHSWNKVVFDPWRQESWDGNDTVLIADPKSDPDAGGFFQRLAEAEYLPTWYAQRRTGELGAGPRDASAKTEIHAATPSVTHADALGRSFLSIAHNRFIPRDAKPGDPPTEEHYATRIVYDIEGNQRQVVDANGRIVMRHDYDMLGTRIHQASMEAGERWMLNDVSGRPLYAWDSRDHQFRTVYDPLRRPTDGYLLEGAGPPLLIGRTVYGDSQLDSETNNLRGKVLRVFDQAGVVTNVAYDFKGNLLTSQRQVAQAYKTTIDWSTAGRLETADSTSTQFDALNRPILVTTPDNSVYQPTFNEASLLETIKVKLRGVDPVTSFVANIDYDAKGRRMLIQYGNNTKTEYQYDALTFRLASLKTTRLSDQALLQDLAYTYDPVGNITQIEDAAQQTIYFDNQVITPNNDYTYDAAYRLIVATGREHIGQVAQTTWNDQSRVSLPQPGDAQAMGRYAERYNYDAVGNILELIHRVTTGHGNWTRTYDYEEPNQLEPETKVSNRLSSTTIGTTNPVIERYTYDAHGNMTSMPHLSLMQSDFHDQLQATSRQVGTAPETTYYVYDAAGQRVRKVTERGDGTRKSERTYLGVFERYREYGSDGATVTLERETLHVMDDKQRVALVETRTQGDDGSPLQLIRYQFGNHLGSASLELDNQAQIISYEEYYPYGSTSYQAVRSQTETTKRYRYTAKERDDETGFNYHGARYCAAWLARWTSADPAGPRDSNNLNCGTLRKKRLLLCINSKRNCRLCMPRKPNSKPSPIRNISEFVIGVPRTQTTPKILGKLKNHIRVH
jgi:RHS repeat-associated protein